MATLIAVYNSEGCVGRCDARCHEAQHDGCDCICGGLNHGAGQEQAEVNTRELAENWVEEYEQRTGQDLGLVEIMGRLSVPGAIVVPEPGQKTIKDPRRLTRRQLEVLRTDAGVIRSSRTANSLLRRGLLEDMGIGQGYGVTTTGRALLNTLKPGA